MKRFLIALALVGFLAVSISVGLRYWPTNEPVKVNINTLAEMERQKVGSGRALLMSLPGMDATTCDAIFDWLDEGR